MRPLRLVALALCLPLLAACGEEEAKDQTAQQTGPAPAASPAPAPAPAPAPSAAPAPVPSPAEVTAPAPQAVPSAPAQPAFVALVETARQALAGIDRADPAALQAAVEAALAARREQQCAYAEKFGLAVSDWNVIVEAVAEVADKTLALQVAIADEAYLATSRNAAGDQALGISTVIVEGAPLYATVAALKPGDQVTVSGSLVTSADGCLLESVPDQPVDAIDSPSYLFQFNSVSKG